MRVNNEAENLSFNEKTARNIRAQKRYDELMKIGEHGHYETMFRVIHEECELATRKFKIIHDRFMSEEMGSDETFDEFMRLFDDAPDLLKPIIKDEWA